MEYSKKARKVNTKHPARKTPIDLGYAVGGRFTLAEDSSVVIVSTVVTPKLTLAGVAWRSSQKLEKEMTTMNVAGMYTSHRK